LTAAPRVRGILPELSDLLRLCVAELLRGPFFPARTFVSLRVSGRLLARLRTRTLRLPCRLFAVTFMRGAPRFALGPLPAFRSLRPLAAPGGGSLPLAASVTS
jgi:hypothetical protein